MLWTMFASEVHLLDGGATRLLHIAPERVLENKFRRMRSLDYLTGDLNNPRAMVQVDITRIQFPDSSFDAICCSHVLEHVADDLTAMREFHRILRTGGWAAILVPMTVQQTLEDPTVTTREQRIAVYGHPDHVRRYGPDCAERLRKAGFRVKAVTSSDLVPPSQATRLGLRDDEVIHLCRK